ncbi:hypothetical protein [Nocardia sp. R6R-6]|uniref:hypothetical protein n=1 Tax=Nocardia sp. R6R-6 TaxID=3459303 RepID=UPI00403D89A7
MSDVVRATLAGLAGLAPEQRLDAARETARSLAAMLAAADLELTPTERARLEGAHLTLDLLTGQADETV